MVILRHGDFTTLTHSTRKFNKQDIARINAIADYLSRREFEAFKRQTLETGIHPNGGQLRQLQNEIHADYQQNMKPEIDALIELTEGAKIR